MPNKLNFKPFMSLMGETVSALGQLKQGLDNYKISKYNQGLSETEAKIELNKSLYNSWIIQSRADIEETQHVEAGRRLIGEQIVEAGASGAAMGSDSVLQNLANTAKDIERDRLLIRFNADLEDSSQRYSSEARAAGLRSEAASQVFSAKMSKSTAILAAGSTLLKANVKFQDSLYTKRVTPTISPSSQKTRVIQPRKSNNKVNPNG